MAQKTVQSLEKGIDLLLIFAADRPLLTVREICQELHIPQSTAYRLLATFRKKRVIIQDPASGKYGLDACMLRLQEAVQAQLDVVKLAAPILHKLARLSGETSQLFLLRGDEVICADKVDSSHALRFMPDKGKGLPLHAPAAGRVVLASLPSSFLAGYIRRNGLRALTPSTITDPAKLRAILRQIRRQGFAISFQQMYIGARGLAVPLFDHRGQVIGSLGISGPDRRYTEERARSLVEPLRAQARKLSAFLGAPAGIAPGGKEIEGEGDM